MVRRLFLAHLAFLIEPVFALAGTWISGGGELLGNARNPWFLKNTKHVTYCVQVNEAEFGVGRDEAAGQVVKALRYWKGEFRNSLATQDTDTGNLGIAQQSFIEVPCSNAVDIQFQFGFLTREQQDRLGNARNYAALTVRTDYDVVQMRGKGFVYFAPPRGRFSPDFAKLPTEMWSEGDAGRLYWGLVHELGHVFGLPHIQNYQSVMAERFVESLLTTEVPTTHPSKYSFFSPAEAGRVVCDDDQFHAVRARFYGFSAKKYSCSQVQFEHLGGFFGPANLRLSVFEKRGSPAALFGTAVLMPGAFFPKFFTLIELPKGQRALTLRLLSQATSGHVLGVSLFSFTKQGTYKSVDGRTEREIAARFEQGGGPFFLEGIQEGAFVRNGL